MWLTLLTPIERPPLRWGGYKLITRQAAWFWKLRTQMDDEIQFLYFFMHFLSNHGRSGNLFIGNAISITHFAQVCAQRAWRDISVLDPSFGSENWMYVHSAIPNALLHNVPDRFLVHLCDVMDLLIRGHVSDEQSSKPADETIIQNIKVSQTPISLSLGSLNRNIFVRCTKMRMADIVDLVKFVKASTTKDQKESFESQLLRWRNTKTEVPVLIGSTLVRLLLFFSVACARSCFTDISISGTFRGTIAPRRS